MKTLCEYCETNTSNRIFNPLDTNIFILEIMEDKAYLIYKNKKRREIINCIDISFCPFCGKKLKNVLTKENIGV